MFSIPCWEMELVAWLQQPDMVLVLRNRLQATMPHSVKVSECVQLDCILKLEHQQ